MKSVFRMLPALVGVAALAGPLSADSMRARPRVFVPDSDSWGVSGGFSFDEDGFGSGHSSGGAKPQTAEIVKTMHERCPEAIVTRNEERADYVLLLEHEGGKIIRKDNKFVLFDGEGDAIASGSTRSLGNAVKDACGALLFDWNAAARHQRPDDRRASLPE